MIKVHCIVAAVVAGFILTAPAQAAGPRASANKGLSHYRNDEYDKALAEFLAGLEAAPDREELQYDAGAAKYKLQDFPGAAQGFGAAAERNGRLGSDAWYNLGNSLIKANKPQDAVKAYINALKQNHKDEDAKHNLELALKLMQMQQQQQQSGESDSTKQQQQQQKQQQQKQQQQEQKEQQAQAAPQQEKPQQGKKKESEMSPEEAKQLLQALEGDEQEAQKEKLRRQFGKPKRVEKDW